MLESIYVDRADVEKGIPTDIPVLLKHAVPLHDAIKMDLHVPGCPPSAPSILFVLNELLDGRMPDLQDKVAFRLRRSVMKTIVIDPVTRIEGHAKITIHLDDDGQVTDTFFHVTQLRGFEKFVEGRPFYEMPSITARICGICPISHLITSAKACEAIMCVTVPPTAVKLREIMHCGQFIQSHALSFFHLSAPDLLLGFDSDPARRNFFGLIEDHPEIARDGIALRRFGQQVIEGLAGERIHPSWTVPGGVNAPLDPAERDRILAGLPAAKATALRTLGFFKGIVDQVQPRRSPFSAIHPTMYAGLGRRRRQSATVRWRSALRRRGRRHRRRSDAGARLCAVHRRGDGAAFVPEGAVFQAARLSRRGSTAWARWRGSTSSRAAAREAADIEFDEYHQRFGKVVQSSFHFHYARLIEIIYCARADGGVAERSGDSRPPCARACRGERARGRSAWPRRRAAF